MSQADASSIMTSASGGLVTSRRNFFTRAFGLTVAGATVAVPVVALASPTERVAHHWAGLEAALREMHPGAMVRMVSTPVGVGDYDQSIGCWVATVSVGGRS